MATNVTKKDGSKQPFDEGKLRKSIEGACQDAGLDSDKTQSVVSEVLSSVIEMANSKEEVATSELREAVLSKLDASETSTAAAWRNYTKNKEE